MDSVLAGLVVGGRDYASARGVTPDDDGFASKAGIVTGVDRGIKAIHVGMQDAPERRFGHHIILRCIYLRATCPPTRSEIRDLKC